MRIQGLLKFSGIRVGEKIVAKNPKKIGKFGNFGNLTLDAWGGIR